MLELFPTLVREKIILQDYERENFKTDVRVGLSSNKKNIPSKYFYDQRGTELFYQITCHPDYYLTRCELEILNVNKRKIAELLQTKSFNLIELGPGDGSKISILIQEFLQHALDFNYEPIDISQEYLDTITTNLSQQFPTLQLHPLRTDFFKTSTWNKVRPKQRNFVLFLGSSIGNLDIASTERFLRKLWHKLRNDDYALIGFDLMKDFHVLMRAYDDDQGITRDFNLNLLRRINRELGGDFKIDKFQHYETYNVYSGAMESHLISQEAQTVHINSLNKSFAFQPFESIHVEYSCKYLPEHIERLARITGFEIVQNFYDSQHYFVDSLWRVKKRNLLSK